MKYAILQEIMWLQPGFPQIFSNDCTVTVKLQFAMRAIYPEIVQKRLRLRRADEPANSFSNFTPIPTGSDAGKISCWVIL